MEQRDSRFSQPVLHTFLFGYGVALGATGLAALVRWLLPGALAPAPYLGFYPAVVVSAALGGLGPGLFATFSSLLLVNFVFGRFNIYDHGAMMRQVIWVVASIGVSLLAEMQRKARQRAEDEAGSARAAEQALRRQVELVDPARAEIIAREMQRAVRERWDEGNLPSPSAERWLGRVADAAGALVAGMGMLVLAGWILDLAPLKSLVPGLASMKANTAICFIFSGLALALREQRALRSLLALAVLAIAGLTMAEYLGDMDLGIDQLLFRDAEDAHTIYPGRMVQATGLGFLATAASLLFLRAGSPGRRGTQQGLALAAGMVGLIAVLGYAYDARQFYRFAGYSSMAPHTGLSFLVLALGLLLARPDGLARILTWPGPAAQMVRRLLPVVLLAPALVGWLVGRGLELGLYGQGMDMALLALVMTVLLATLVWWTAAAVNRVDTARRESETQLLNQAAVMNQSHAALIISEKGGVIRYWNRGAEELYGWTAAEALGRSKQLLLHGEGEEFEALERQLELTGRWEGELPLRTADGRRIIVESRQNAARGADGRLLVLESNHDITERKRAEEALRRSEERLRLAQQVARIGSFEWNIERQMTEWSPELEALHGLPPGGIGGSYHEWAALVHPDDLPETERQLRESLASGLLETEWRILLPDGAIRWVAARGQVFKDQTGKPLRMVGVNLDITEQKRTEEALQRNEARMRAVFDALVEGVVLLDPAGEVTLVNDAVQRLHGHDLQELQDDALDARGRILRSDGTPFPVEEQPALLALRAGIAVRDVEMGVPLPDGTIRWRLVNAQPVRDHQGNLLGAVTSFFDITERKRAEEAIKESESFYRQILESIPGMVFTTRPDGYCDYQSQQWVDFTGVPMQEHLGDGWNKLLHPDDRPRAFAAWRAAVEERAQYDLEYRVRRYDGRYQWFKVIGRPIRDVDGQIVRWFGVAADIDAIKETEIALKQAYDDLEKLAEERTRALKEKEVLLSEIHHRVKNNMQVISSMVNLQAAELKDQTVREVFNEVTYRVRSMALVHEKLYQSGNLASIDFGEYATSLLNSLWRSHGSIAAPIRLSFDLQPVQLSVDTAVPCGLILNELAVNALMHAFRGREGGTVTVSLAQREEGRVALRVADDGVGMPEELDWRQAGSLGLRLVLMLAKQIGASVEMSSGAGTAFTILFPAAMVAPGAIPG